MTLNNLPFDIKAYRVTQYSTHFKSFDRFSKELARYLNGVVDGAVAFGNPVTDFLYSKNITDSLKEQSVPTGFTDDLEDMGFLDYLNTIEEEMILITASVNSIGENIDEMSSGIGDCTNEIKRVSEIGGTGTVSFMRKQAKKAAKHIANFSQRLNDHNEVLLDKWPSVEQSCLLLLKNKHMDSPEYKEDLMIFLDTLGDMRKASLSAKNEIDMLIDTLKTLLGIESSLNQAINSLENDLRQFSTFIEQMSASIRRILEISKIDGGSIDLTKE